MQGDFRAARPLFEEAVELYRNADDAAGTIEALRRLAWAVADANDLKDAERIVDEVGRVAQATGDDHLLASAAAIQVFLPTLRGDLEEARQRLDRMLVLYEQIGDEEGVAFDRSYRAFLMLLEGRGREALPALEDTLQFYRQVQYPNLMATITQRVASVLAACGATEEAVQIFAAAESFLRTRGVEATGPFLELEQRAFAPVRRAAEDPTYADAVAAGQAMTLDEAADFALAVARRLRDATTSS
jgi:ATP/maltotriose-dependent transcriptional regulator MalT